MAENVRVGTREGLPLKVRARLGAHEDMEHAGWAGGGGLRGGGKGEVRLFTRTLVRAHLASAGHAVSNCADGAALGARIRQRRWKARTSAAAV